MIREWYLKAMVSFVQLTHPIPPVNPFPQLKHPPGKRLMALHVGQLRFIASLETEGNIPLNKNTVETLTNSLLVKPIIIET